ncbi:Tetratricopeptide-like helical domain [Cinara cedri]|uniref:Tetratricopeptide-like helical domain n=1 Tax=Cinara cedri TaxID=506608 RepID=A0A5E4M1F2_9HEMI|nr:Tetratricopeptide-like helical domain [Cinara cedri]
MIRSVTELIKYYKVLFNYIKVKQALVDGLRYSNKCLKIPDAKNECYKWKALLLETYVFRHKFILTRFTRMWFNGAYARAHEVIPDDKMLKFTETKVACEIKLMVENKNGFTRNLSIIVKGITKSERNFDCIKELLKYEQEIENVGSYPGEYYYLLGRAYAKQGDNQKAIECLAKARLGPIVCQKTRHKNKNIQELYEKLYIFNHGVF